MDPIPPSLPFRLAKAYGVQPTQQPAKSERGVTVTPVGNGAYTGVQPTDKADLSSVDSTAAIREKLVAAKVPGGVSFEGGRAVPGAPASQASGAAASLPFYRHPADRNAAATSINLGTHLDTRG